MLIIACHADDTGENDEIKQESHVDRYILNGTVTDTSGNLLNEPE